MCGCAQKIEQEAETGSVKAADATTQVNTPSAADHAVDTSEILNDIDAISKDISNINVDDLGDVIIPVSADDLTNE